ncbi:MAG: Fe-S cluster protein [Beggiatoa sp. IS2]|nr:MAG: Fe-S cluster protein [Beggiatoa sp. IS2]
MAIGSIIVAGSFMAALGGGLAGVLALANKKLYVYEDPRIEQVEEMLPHANCGACGTPGCRQFAEATVSRKLDPGKCTVNSVEMNAAIADFLGVDVVHHERRVARLACAGGNHVAHIRANYKGLQTCRAAGLVAGGGKGCTWGCLGFGDCARVCNFGAIEMNKFGLPVVDEDKCTACNDCVEICPKTLFSIHPVSHRLWVACSSLAEGDEAESDCEVVCTACGRCAADAPEGLIEIKNNLALVDYAKNDLASPVAIERCPTGAIVWVHEGEARRGIDAKKIARKEPMRFVRIEPLPRG